MPLVINLVELKEQAALLKGRLTPLELGLTGLDELIHPEEPLEYDLKAELMDRSLLVEGAWRIPIGLECSRCLKRFLLEVGQENWTCHLPLSGEEAMQVVNDSVDLTLPLREDILLALPSHPVCAEGCVGLSKERVIEERGTAPELSSGTWAALDKLKL